MSSETLNALDTLSKDKSDEGAINEPSRKSSKKAMDGVVISNNNHSTGVSRDPIKKSTLLIQRDRNESSIKMHLESSKTKDSNLISGKYSSPKNSYKKLSFFHGDDDDSDGSSSSLSLHRPTSTKWTAKSEMPHADNSKGYIREGREVTCTARSKEHKLDRTIEPNHDNASSTSSCSCEDHSSVAGRSDDLHEDLDYDEDSVGNSPLKTPVNTTSRLGQEPANDPTGSSKETNKSSTVMSAIESGSNTESGESIDAHPVDEESSNRMKKDTHIRNNTRIKSVINLNRDNNQDADNSGKCLKKEEKINDKSHKSYDDLLKYFFKDACYFQIKSINHENVELSKSMGVWSTPVQNELRLNSAFREHRNVILIFSVQQSGGFQGFARMISESRPSNRPIPWVLPERLSRKSLGGVFKVEWLCAKELPFYETHELYNPFNSNKPVKIARDGQQVEPKVGKKLCKLFPHDSKTRLLSCVATLRRQTSQRKKSSHRHDNIYPFTDRRDYSDDQYRQGLIPMPGMNGFGKPALPSQFCQDYISHDPYSQNFGPVGRRRALEQPNLGIYQRQNIYPSHFGSVRAQHMPRSMEGSMPRCLAPGNPNDFPYHQGFTPPPGHQFIHPYDAWSPDVVRYRPYHRSRR